ncbi:MAG: type II toxin-antitoxin system Phd/YefM family antitoxin [Microcystaceae cyanobacterium]
MQTYTLTQRRNQHGEVFDHAKLEPVLITKQQRPSHVILSIEAYQQLLEHIQNLEDQKLGQAAQIAETQSERVGTEAFTAALKELANA